MKLRICGLFFLVWTLSGIGAVAQDHAFVALQMPPDLPEKFCPHPIWKELSVQWMGTDDRRPRPEVGWEMKKGGREPVQVLPQTPLAVTVDAALRKLLSQCGMRLSETASRWRMGATIEEFHTEIEKGLIFGKGKAKSRLALFAESPDRKLSASVGYEIEFKKTRKKSLQRLTETLNELFHETLRQIPQSSQLRDMAP